MIIFVLHCMHDYTHKAILGIQDAPHIALWSYDQAFSEPALPKATYIFGDFDRLNAWDCELAGRLYRYLKAAGMRVLNDGSRVKQRYALLKALHRKEVNTFQVWSAGARIPTDRYPVFLRTASSHRGVASDLLYDRRSVLDGVEKLNDVGIPLAEIMVVEYAAEEIRPDLFRKLAAFNVDGKIIPTISVHDDNWMAKHGKKGIAGQDLYDEEYALIETNPYKKNLARAFNIAQIRYGRADFAIVNGRPEIYEINTNPQIGAVSEHPFQRRIGSWSLFLKNYLAALRGIDSAPGDPIKIDDPVLQTQRRKDQSISVRSRWAP